MEIPGTRHQGLMFCRITQPAGGHAAITTITTTTTVYRLHGLDGIRQPVMADMRHQATRIRQIGSQCRA